MTSPGFATGPPAATDATSPATPPTPPRSGRAGRALVLALAGVLLVSIAAQIRIAGSGATTSDVRVMSDAPIAIVLCVLDAMGRTRCHGKDGVLTGSVDWNWAGVCGIADRRLESPCPDGAECVFKAAARRGDLVGLIVLEARPPFYGIPRHRFVDSAVLSPPGHPTSLTQGMAHGVQTVARCFAPSDGTAEEHPAPILLPGGCVDGPCRLQHSSVQMLASTHRP